MTLPAGSRVGPYEIGSLLGAGGMGAVYRARDTRLDRDVALKVIKFDGAQPDPDRLRRFEQEARAVAAINHPNVVVIHDAGTHEGAPWLVTELLEGETLRQRLDRSPVPARLALELAAQIARGLAAAHARGIVHRDLKPANLFLTRTGQLKILDFGLAKLSSSGEAASATGTLTEGTEAGSVLGSPGYMSPEQVRGQPADARSDLFSLGVVLYELLTGQRPFPGATRIDIGYATLNSEPPDVPGSSAPLQRVLHGCLAKAPELRFQSASDLALTLEALNTESSTRGAPAVAAGRSRSATWKLAAISAGVLLVLGLGAERILRPPPAASPHYTRVNFRRGTVTAARFAPDGMSVVFSGEVEGEPSRVYLATPGRPEARPVSEDRASLLAVSAGGELLLELEAPTVASPSPVRTLARAPLAGGAPRQLATHVVGADWTPDGARFALAFSEPNTAGNASRVEFPQGTVVYASTAKGVDDVRVSPGGDRVAFVADRQWGNNGGRIMIAGPGEPARPVTGELRDVGGIAWSPDGREIWFTASRNARRRSLWAVTLDGRERLVLEAPGSLGLKDISKDGRVLLSLDDYSARVLGVLPGREGFVNLAWRDATWIYDLTPDGKTLLFEEQGQSSEENSVWVRELGGNRPPVKLADGIPYGISPDGQWVVEAEKRSGTQLVLVPTGPGAPRPVPPNHFRQILRAFFFPDGAQLLLSAKAPGRPERLWVQALDGGEPRPVSEEGVWGWRTPPSPDGRSIIGVSEGRPPVLIDLESGTATALAVDVGMVPVQWTEDGRGLYLKQMWNEALVKYDLQTRTHEPWPSPTPPILDRAGVQLFRTVMSRDGKTVVYGYHQNYAELYVVEGLR